MSQIVEKQARPSDASAKRVHVSAQQYMYIDPHYVCYSALQEVQREAGLRLLCRMLWNAQNLPVRRGFQKDRRQHLQDRYNTA